MSNGVEVVNDATGGLSRVADEPGGADNGMLNGSPIELARTPIHERKIQINSYLRDDDLWDLEATLLDVKAYDFPKKSGAIHFVGNAVHDMSICVTVTQEGEIVAAKAKYHAAPYDKTCFAIENAYNALIGLHLLRSFRQRVRERFARTRGCTHMSELIVLLPTVFVQSLAKARNKRNESQGKRPFQLEGCYALRLGSPAVKEFFPQWYRADSANDV